MRAVWIALVSALLVATACGSDEDENTGRGGSGGTAGGSGASGASGGSAASGMSGTGGTSGTSGTSGSGGTGGASGACTLGTAVFSSDFEDGSLAGMWVDGDATISTAQAHSGTRSALYAFTGAGHFGLTDLSAFDQAYVELWVWLDDMPCLQNCDPAGKHFFRFAWWPDKSGGIAKQIDTGLLNGDVGAFSFGFGVPTVGEWKPYGDAIKTGVWQRVRTAFRANAPGVADGRFVWMFDDVAVLDLSGEYVAAGETLDTFMFTNYDIEPGDGITKPQVYVDDWVMRSGPGAFDCMTMP